jgi:hypothetical protein
VFLGYLVAVEHGVWCFGVLPRSTHEGGVPNPYLCSIGGALTGLRVDPLISKCYKPKQIESIPARRSLSATGIEVGFNNFSFLI